MTCLLVSTALRSSAPREPNSTLKHRSVNTQIFTNAHTGTGRDAALFGGSSNQAQPPRYPARMVKSCRTHEINSMINNVLNIAKSYPMKNRSQSLNHQINTTRSSADTVTRRMSRSQLRKNPAWSVGIMSPNAITRARMRLACIIIMTHSTTELTPGKK